MTELSHLITEQMYGVLNSKKDTRQVLSSLSALLDLPQEKKLPVSHEEVRELEILDKRVHDRYETVLCNQSRYERNRGIQEGKSNTTLSFLFVITIINVLFVWYNIPIPWFIQFFFGGPFVVGGIVWIYFDEMSEFESMVPFKECPDPEENDAEWQKTMTLQEVTRRQQSLILFLNSIENVKGRTEDVIEDMQFENMIHSLVLSVYSFIHCYITKNTDSYDCVVFGSSAVFCFIAFLYFLNGKSIYIMVYEVPEYKKSRWEYVFKKWE